MNESPHDSAPRTLRRTVAIVAALNFGYFFVEFAIAVSIASVALFADSIDFLEDATINTLVLVALGWTAARRRLVGLVLALCLLVPGLAALYTAWEKVADPSIPDPVVLTLAGVGALAVNAFCAFLLSRVRNQGGSLTLAAFLSARNDVAANLAIIVAGLMTVVTGSMWPDVVAGLGIALLNSGSAYEVYEAAMDERDGDDLDEARA
jgi:Co/Zn/Cd efflux system component